MGQAGAEVARGSATPKVLLKHRRPMHVSHGVGGKQSQRTRMADQSVGASAMEASLEPEIL